MQSVSGKLTKEGIITEDGHELVIEKIERWTAGSTNEAKGLARKKRGKKLFRFIVKSWGEVLIVM